MSGTTPTTPVPASPPGRKWRNRSTSSAPSMRVTPPSAAAPGAPVAPRRPRIRVQPGKSWPTELPELWAHREMLYFLVLRNLKVRFRQTVLGATWAVVQPLALMTVFVLFVEKVIKVPSEGVPYPLFAFAALIPWGLFSQSLAVAAESVVRDINLVSKVYVPRLILPLAAVTALLVDFVIGFGILFVMMALYSTYPDVSAFLWLPLMSVLALALSLAIGIWLSALMVMYRDVRSIVPVLIQMWLFATPVAYPSSLVPEAWRAVYGLNPMAGVVEGFRSALLGTPAPDTAMLAVSAAVTVVLLAGGLTYFRRVERIFADII